LCFAACCEDLKLSVSSSLSLLCSTDNLPLVFFLLLYDGGVAAKEEEEEDATVDLFE
jgi:hypothetical protein